MSNLSTAEVTAGVSRKALDTLRAQSQRKTLSAIVSAYRSTRVIDTPMLLLDVLESNSGDVMLRSTEYLGERVSVVHIHLEYHQAHALASVLRDLEPPEEFQSTKNGKVRP